MAVPEERPRLSRATVVQQALALIDAEGLDRLTIRRLAQRLDVTPMALYWHFKNKEQLLAAVADHMWSLVDGRVDPASPWIDRLRGLMESIVDVLRAHPAAAPLVMNAQLEAEHCFAILDTALGVLDEAGFPPEQAAAICGHGLRTAITLVIRDPDLTPRQTPEEVAEIVRRKRITLETLPPDRFPHLVRAAKPLTMTDDPDAHFAFGIALFIAGVEALAPRD